MQLGIFLSFLLTFLSRYLFWSYVFQLKEYRFDRFKEYLGTPQGKKSFFSKFFIVEVFLFSLLLISFLVSYILGNVIFVLFFYGVNLAYFSVLGIYYFFKLILKKQFFPKNTFRQLLIFSVSFFILILVFGLFFLLNLIESIFSYLLIFILLIFPYLLLFLSNVITLPFVNYQKQKIINEAKMKAKNNKNTIKIGVTGSYGKSSVKEYLAFLLGNVGKTLQTPENINTEMGVSNVILQKLDESFEYFVAEMGAYKIGEIKTLGEIVNHKYGFLTAIGTQHIGLFGSQENIIKGKSEIALKVLENDGILYVNGDNENIKNTKFDKKLRVVKYGLTSKNDAKSDIIGFNDNLLEFRFVYKDRVFLLKTNLLGDHNILNLTGVLAFLSDLGIDLDLVKNNLLNLPKPKHTLDITKKGNLTLIDDTYNLSVDGLFAGIETLKYFDGEKILVVDDILELGKNSKKVHFELGKKIGDSKKIDKVLFVGENYKKEFIDGLISSGFDKENILKDLLNISGTGILLFEGRKARKFIDF